MAADHDSANARAATGRSPVSLATWERGTHVHRDGPGRGAAVRQAAVMAAAGILLRFGLGRTTTALVVWCLAAAVLALGLIWPAGFRPIHRFGRTLGRWTGTLLVYLLLVPFFYLCVTPAALLLRLQGRDPLHRSWREPRHTYWIRRRPKERDENIDRQFLREDRAARAELRDVAADDLNASAAPAGQGGGA